MPQKCSLFLMYVEINLLCIITIFKLFKCFQCGFKFHPIFDLQIMFVFVRKIIYVHSRNFAEYKKVL